MVGCPQVMANGADSDDWETVMSGRDVYMACVCYMSTPQAHGIVADLALTGTYLPTHSLVQGEQCRQCSEPMEKNVTVIVFCTAAPAKYNQDISSYIQISCDTKIP